jgi:acetoin utilization deacetylase AcuC-like enzyme
MSTIIIRHDDCLRHDPGAGHPESVQRLQAVMAALEGLDGIEKLPAPLATVEQITRAHPLEYWNMVQDAEPGEGRVGLDADTFVNSGSIEAAQRAAGGMCFAVDQVLAGKAQRAFCAVRPPGHHAEAAIAMGFCLLNNVAIGALQALEHPSVSKVAILDFDVHHGNGTQAIFEANPDVMFISSHQQPLYPGTGYADETGCGNVLNLPLAPGDGSAAFREAWRERALPAASRFDPDLVLVSAGFDAHARDPLAQLELRAADYRWITEEICTLAEDCCAGRVVSVLEGGYDLEALAASCREHVSALGC